MIIIDPMKKRPFVLLELFIAIAMVAFFSLPLVQGHSFYVKKQKERLLKLEKERKAEELFYEICKNLTQTHPLEKITGAWKKEIHTFKTKSVTFDLGKLGKEPFYWHYHLYSHHTSKEKPCRKLHCKICFIKDPKQECNTPRKFADADYGFILTIQKQAKSVRIHK